MRIKNCFTEFLNSLGKRMFGTLNIKNQEGIVITEEKEEMESTFQGLAGV